MMGFAKGSTHPTGYEIHPAYGNVPTEERR
jgi:hypothetical protein